MPAVAPLSRPATPPDTAVFQPAHALTGRQKAAVIVRLLIAQGASVPLAALPEDQQAALTEQMAAMRAIDRDTLAAVVEEFCDTLERMGLSFPGGLDGALKVLDGHISDAAAGRLRRLAGGASKLDPWEKIRGVEVERLLPIITEESTEVAAVILSKIAVPRAAELLGLLPGDRARRIAFSMSKTADVEPETVKRIGHAILGQIEVVKTPAFEKSPADRVGAILNVSPAATREDVLKALEEEDSVLAAEVRKTIFTFAHIPARLLTRDVPKIIKVVEQDVLIKALAGAKGEAADAAEFLLANMSQRMAGSLREEMAAIGRLKEKDVEVAQTAVVIAIRDLEAAGELVMIVPEEEEEG
ncbi:flagellar motor switch protein FliG [Frigidibacter sp. RF13]|uniref:flagellar motor switch protein FliG n=1 Tax=Frigidibacter sp. RF13 TaxID=2997340 RepID=UPI00227027CA|nr:FliG C-terminal domain-containing protein [Frigidibacter sp. RF13]MCY1125441.1 flagellar motor switch protein FliG [Frigidibacter sp. RF13]